MSRINFHNIDCMEFMANVPDKFYKLAIVDPPYGIGVNKMNLGNGKKKVYRGESDWDVKPPPSDYWRELFRISVNQIVWGGNYMTNYLPIKSGWLFWDKETGSNDFSDGELAWTSFDGALRKITKQWIGSNAKDESNRIHPTQKPVYLYRWILHQKCKPGDNIFDSHGGSMSIAIACDMEGYDLDVCEIDKEYFDAAVKRFNTYKQQLILF